MTMETLEIQNFKSIKHLGLDCKRVNVFIGEPNTGKSNILESLGMLSFGYYSGSGYNLKQFVRFETIGNLFYDESLDDEVIIVWDDNRAVIQYTNGRFRGSCYVGGTEILQMDGSHNELKVMDHRRSDPLVTFKYYKFGLKEQFTRENSDFLLPPSGDNLMSLLLTKKDLRALANQPFASRGLRLGLRPQEHKIEVLKDYQDVIVSYPYHLTSETLQRLVFYMAAIVYNEESVLVFEEPESHAFPFYTKYMAEMIALDENSNQYFISTHNPYFLMPLLEKASIDEIGVFITYYEDYQTKVKPLERGDLERLTEIDVFSNLEMFLEG